MKHAHTAGPWTWEYHPDFPDFSKVLALHFNERDVLLCSGETRAWGEISAADSALIALAPAAPHDCDVPGCQGPRNKALLEAGQALAMLVLQSDLYQSDMDVRDQVDTLLPAKAQDAKVGK